jgi:outer membrane protein assembly factor BamB
MPYATALVGVDSACGAERWRVTLAGQVLRPPVVGPGGTVYVGVSYPPQLVAVQPGGNIAWSVPLEAPGDLWVGTTGPVGADGTIYVVMVAGASGGVPAQVAAFSPAGRRSGSFRSPGCWRTRRRSCGPTAR